MHTISRPKAIFLFFIANVPFWILYLVNTHLFRLAVILLAFVAMWSLWVARRERRHLWTPKLHDIWLCLFLWSVAAVEGNLELFYRHAGRPSLASLLVVAILWLTVKGVFNNEKYTINQP